MAEPRLAVIGGTGAVGSVTLQLLREGGYNQVRVFASARSAGRAVHAKFQLYAEERVNA